MRKSIFKILKKSILIFMTTLVMTGVFSINNVKEVDAANTGNLKVGSYIEAGYGIRPGDKAPNTYLIDTTKDTFNYINGQYININVGAKSYTTNKPELGVYYITHKRDWVSTGYHDTGSYVISEVNEYYKNGKYVFYIYSSTDFADAPIALYFDAEDTGKPAWGIKVVSGDGTQGNPFNFALVKDKPHDIIVDSVVGGGTVELDYTRAEPGENVTFKVYPSSGREVEYVDVYTDTKIKTTNTGNQYSFVMPSSYHEGYETVKVRVGFKDTSGIFEIEDASGKKTIEDMHHNAMVSWKPGTTLRLKKDVFDGNSISAINGNGAYTLDLNGFTYTSNVGNEVVEVNDGVNLTIIDSSSNKTGKLTHLNDSTITTGCGAIVNGGGTLTLESGTITGNKSGVINNDNGKGAGVYVASGATFTMTGGTISNNTSSKNGGGVYVDDGATFNMYGGTITGNTSTDEGAGIYNNGTLNVKGNITVNNNHKGNENNNVSFATDKIINITDTLESESRIGITYEAGKVFTNGFDGKATINNFISNVNGKTVFVTTEKELKLDDETKYDLWVNGTQVTSANANSIPIESGSATYDASENALYLNDATILFERVVDGSIARNVGILYTGEQTLNIVLSGTNNISQTNNDGEFYSSYPCHGIRSKSDIKISGNESDGRDTLNITFKKANVDGISYMNGIYSFDKDTTIENADINIDTDSGYLAYSIYTNDLTLTKSNVTIINTAQDENATGIYAYYETGNNPEVTIDNNSSLEITSYSRAIYSNKSVASYNSVATSLGALVNTDASSEGATKYRGGNLGNYKYVRIPYTTPTYTITWKDGDGNTLKTETIEEGTLPTYSGTTPTKTSTAEYEYTFNNTWSPSVVAATKDETYTAQFNSVKRKYKINFVNDDDNETILQSSMVEYGTTPVYSGVTPTKESTTAASFEFDGWTPEIESVTGEKTYKVHFTETPVQYEITFVDSDGTKELQKSLVAYGTMPVYSGDTPTQAGKTFTGWTPAITPVTGAAKYTATYNENTYKARWVYDTDELIKDTVTGSMTEIQAAFPTNFGLSPKMLADETQDFIFLNWNSREVGDVTEYVATYSRRKKSYTITWKKDETTTISTTELLYHAPLVYSGETPTEEGCTFVGWNTQADGSGSSLRSTVVGNETYYAVFVKNKYTVTWVDYDGKVLKTQNNVAHNSKPSYGEANPTRESTAEYTYTFSKWEPEITDEIKVTSDITYKAQYTSAVRKYPVTWVIDNTTSTSEDLDYGTMPYHEDPTKTGLKFVGWTPAITPVTGAVTYTAQFSNEYTVTLDDCLGNKKQIKVTKGSRYGALPEASKDNRIFGGWWTKNGNEFVNEITPITVVAISDNQTLYARYLIDVSFYSGDGLYIENYIYDDLGSVADAKPKADPTKEGYKFMYWVDNSGNEFNFNSPIIEGLSLRAAFYNYQYTGSANNWTLDDKGDLLFAFERHEFITSDVKSTRVLTDMFEANGNKVFVDNTQLAASDYSYKEGSLKVFLHDSYLNKLSAGTHTLRVEFADGSVSTNFVVKEKPKPVAPSYIIPKTGI